MGRINSSSKPLVLFDIGGVLIRWRDEWAFEVMARRIGVPVRRLEEEILPLRHELQSGRLAVEGFVTELSSRLGVPLPPGFPGIWTRELSRRAQVNRSALGIAGRLRRQGFQTGLFSNTDPSHVQIFHERNWFPDMAPQLFSCDLGAAKPDPAAFEGVERATGLARARILLIDDRPSNIQGARRRGWQALRYVNARRLAHDLTHGWR